MENNTEFLKDKLRIIQEIVPGKQISLAHIIANPDSSVYERSHIKPPEKGGAVGIVNITPAEASIILADIALKGAKVKIEFIDRINGTLILSGTVSEVEAAVSAAILYSTEKLGFSCCEITKT